MMRGLSTPCVLHRHLTSWIPSFTRVRTRCTYIYCKLSLTNFELDVSLNMQKCDNVPVIWLDDFSEEKKPGSKGSLVGMLDPVR
jgi:hypothetical protein